MSMIDLSEYARITYDLLELLAFDVSRAASQITEPLSLEELEPIIPYIRKNISISNIKKVREELVFNDRY